MRKAYTTLDNKSDDVATDIERMAEELENVEDPLNIVNLADEIDGVISTLGI